MSHYNALPHTEQEADRMSDISSTEGDTIGEPHQTVITASNRQNADTSPAELHSSAQSPTDVLHKGNGFQQVPLEFENLGGSQNLEIPRNDGGSAIAAALLGVSPSKRESVLSSVLHQLRKPSFETMYSMVEDDDYAVVDLPEDQGTNPNMKSKEDSSKAGSPDAKSVESHVGDNTESKGKATEELEHDHDSPADTTLDVKGHPPVPSASKTEEAKQESLIQPIDTSASKPGKRAPIAILIPSPPAHSTTTSHHSRPETPTSVVPQTPISVHSSVDIASPTPDLQSLQGAYVGNIQRLERSVEHLSGTSDIDSELRKMEREMKDRASSSGSASARRSTSAIGSPASGPIVASPERYAQSTNKTTSPRAALAMHLRSHSGSYPATSRLPNTLNEVPEPDENDQLLGGDLSMASDINDAASFTRSAMPPPMTPSPTLQPVLDVQVTTPSTVHADQHENIAEDLDIPQFEYGSYGYANGHDLGYHQPDLYMPTYPPQMQHDLFIQRPPSAASGDTYQQAKIAFKDFDGVHIGLHPRPSVSIRRFDMDGASLNEHPTNPDGSPLTTAIGPDGQVKNIEGLVYYPAPVPRMLNMPLVINQLRSDNTHEASG
ncbi:DNA replication protein, partial [Ascosphaera pollenicola]